MDAMTFVLFGSTGDLAKRKIFPALYNLYLDEKLPNPISIIGLGRKSFTDNEFQQYVEQSIRKFSRRNNEAVSELFLKHITYFPLDVSNKQGYLELLDFIKRREQELGIPENRLFYMSVASEFFDVIAFNIKESGLGNTRGWKRLIIEKPFGRDLESARRLNEKLTESFDEEEIYRIDHYLGKPMVQNLEALEFANPVLQALWSNQYIANVQITASETVGVEERAGYYDHYGAVRDMFQNHMLQILMMTAMHPPKRIASNEIRTEKRKILERLRPLSKKDAASSVVRGQYSYGVMQQKAVVEYRQEPGVDEASMTDTFIAARLWIDDPFWEGVPFYIRTGKRMKEKLTRIVIEFKNPFQDPYQNLNEDKMPNLFIITINPNESVALQLNSKSASNNGQLEPVTVNFEPSNQDTPEAYELLLFDALRGDSTFFAHWNEVELAWQWVQPVLEAFEENSVPLQPYPAGSNGPEASERLLQEQGYHWW